MYPKSSRPDTIGRQRHPLFAMQRHENTIRLPWLKNHTPLSSVRYVTTTELIVATDSSRTPPATHHVNKLPAEICRLLKIPQKVQPSKLWTRQLSWAHNSILGMTINKSYTFQIQQAVTNIFMVSIFGILMVPCNRSNTNLWFYSPFCWSWNIFLLKW